MLNIALYVCRKRIYSILIKNDTPTKYFIMILFVANTLLYFTFFLMGLLHYPMWKYFPKIIIAMLLSVIYIYRKSLLNNKI